MITLALAVGLAIFFSFSCSLMEAALYSIPWSTIELLRKSGQGSGKILFEMRSSVDQPIAAILTINTIANTAGATIAGGAFLAVYGEAYMPYFAMVFTVLILVFGEIIPKTLGVAYASNMARLLAYPLAFAVKILKPIIWLSAKLTNCITRNHPQTPEISEDDICAVVGLSRKAGQIKEYEAKYVRNVLALDRKHVHKIMTPRTVVFSLSANITVEEAYQDPRIWQFSRIPLYERDNEDIIGLVERRTIAHCLKDGFGQKTLKEIMHQIHFVQESQTLDVVLQQMLKCRMHLFCVVDEYGGLSGVVSLEDVLEEMIGSEVMDESDAVADMQALARAKTNPFRQGKGKGKG
ncbi:MAG: HlyC/CorC family transporter [Desulfovibrionaceae bacterium]|nr:HlyC/CorC family transporter [Desulfovibrionaceae bacterium]